MDEHRFHLCIRVNNDGTALCGVKALCIALYDLAVFVSDVRDAARLVKDDIQPRPCRYRREGKRVLLAEAVRNRLAVDAAERGAVADARLGILLDILAQDLRDPRAFLVQSAKAKNGASAPFLFLI